MDELLARLKHHGNGQQQQPSPEPRSTSAQQHTSSQSLWANSQQSPSPLISTISSPQSSSITPPTQPTAGTPGADNDRMKLLNLLRPSGAPGQQPSQSSPMANLQNVSANRHSASQVPTIQSLQASESSQPRPLSAHDLMLNLQRKPSSQSITAAASAEKQDSAPSKSQDILLNLFKKPAPQPQSPAPSKKSPEPSSDGNASQIVPTPQSRAQREPTPVRQFGSPANASSPFEGPQASKTSKFSYVNPFDQLHSSSPLNRDRLPLPFANTETKKIEILKHDRDTTSSHQSEVSAPVSKSRKLESGDTASVPAVDNKSSQSVSKALEGVGEQVDKQVEQALAAASEPAKKSKSAIGVAAKDREGIKKEKVDNGDVESSWESAAEDEKKALDSVVEVFNFPMKPFVSIQIKPKPARPIRQDNFMVIAQLKNREFDQIDRCMATASKTHIVYAQVASKKDNGGLRIIRQDSGDHKQVYRSSGERIFSVQLCNSDQPSHDVETVLGTGVNGSIFWTSLAKSRGDLFADDDVEVQGFFMPAVQTAEENTSGSPVKTRAKMSCRHPDFFAIARGKQIYIISPDTVKSPEYCNQTTRMVDSEQYFKDHTLKINTGKAGKDFAFSEDDTVIVSLDKNGRFKFWDIRDLTSRAIDISESKHDPVEMKDPLWTMNAVTSGSKPDEKPSVSSIMFLDKDRPVTKGCALRYVLIGFKQNHILQLWDLGLGKAVQEIRLPHEKDSDGICSITYHPRSGIIAVGHPTRNSIYFIHLSAPKYNIPTMDQARYISMLARNDPNLPRPESTAIMSGLREFSFAKVGQLRSLDMLRQPVDNVAEKNSADEPMFELYIMHSKGVIGTTIKREDLGWDAQSKMINPKDAETEGVIVVSELVAPQKASSEQSSNADVAPKAAKSAVANKKPEPSKSKADVKKEVAAPATPAKASNGIPRLTSPEPTKPLPQLPKNPPLMTPESYALAAQSGGPSKKEGTVADKVIVSPPTAPATSAAPASSVSSDAVNVMMGKQFDSLYQRIDADKRVSDAAAGAKQDALLRLVSSTLTENVDASLTKIITARIEKDVIPALADITSKVVDRKIGESLPQQLNTSVAAAMKATLSNTLQQALKDKDVHRTIADITGNQVAAKVQQQVSHMLQQHLPGMASQASQKMISDLEGRIAQQQRQADVQRQQDNAKIEELSSIVRSLSVTMQNMAASQSAFQEQILKMQRENKPAPSLSTSSADAPVEAEADVEPEDPDVASMTNKLMTGQFEDATIQVCYFHS